MVKALTDQGFVPPALAAMPKSYAELLKVRGRIPWRRALRWACNTAAALDVIHPLGVVHLDLKPANLFLGVLAATTWITFFTVMKSKRLSDFLDLLSDDREPGHRKIAAFLKVWVGKGRKD